MEHFVAILGLAVLCALWVLVQLASGRGPSTCKGDGKCDTDGDACTRRCEKKESTRPPVKLVSTDAVVRRHPE